MFKIFFVGFLLILSMKSSFGMTQKELLVFFKEKEAVSQQNKQDIYNDLNKINLLMIDLQKNMLKQQADESTMYQNFLESQINKPKKKRVTHEKK